MDERTGALVAIGLVVLLMTPAVVAAADIVATGENITVAIEDGNGTAVGPVVNFDGAVDITTENIRPDNSTIDLGPASFSSQDASEMTISNDDITGAETTVRQIDAGQETLWIDRNDQRVGVDGSISEITFQAVDLNDTTTTEISVTGSGTVSVAGFSPNQGVRATGTTNTVATADSNGVVTLSLADDSITLVESNDPQLSGAAPSGGELRTEDPLELSVNLNHDDFEAGTVVDLEWSVNGNVVGSTTASSPGTQTLEVSNGTVGGDNTWSVTATDSEGDTASNGPNSFQRPDEIQIRDETAPETLLSNADVTLEFYFEGGTETEPRVVERTTPDGSIDMTDLPADQPFVVVADTADYAPRRIYVENILETQQIYLLPESADSVQPEFELRDFTGNYPTEDTVLEIERAIDGEWQTVQGDFFGATGSYSTTLLRNQEHRLTVINLETGQERPVGRYTPTLDAAETIEITGTDSVILDRGAPLVVVEPSTRALPAIDGQTISTDIEPGSSALKEVTMTITYENATTTDELFAQTYTEPGNVTVDQDVNLESYSGGLINVSVAWATVDGEQGVRSYQFTIRDVFDDNFGLLSALSTVPDRLASGDGSGVGGVLTFIAVLLTVVITSAAAIRLRLSTESAGAVALISMAGFWTLGWLPGTVVFASCVAFGVLAAMRRGI